ncbi:hypothetical protein [Amycolatopsis sp. H20-H5]|uniref:hypothetical protein n=1 Tax=Amycolatopsis sp. H20-H5 TaxID=3046309 RepID=UPI002DB81F0D|nr:hypothetical protein [Amycolatopsis sp. H20-H5]MEC3981469.1 hypothetical protein [Amycolatopsis sp. H20-H5]
MPRSAVVAAFVALLLTALSAPALATSRAEVSVTGAVATPVVYTASQLAALGETTYPVTNPGRGQSPTVTGVDLAAVVALSAPVLPPGKNTALRVTLTVTGAHDSATFALAELDPGFGHHPAVLTTGGSGVGQGVGRSVGQGGGRSVGLVVPGDRNRTRSVADVRSVRVAASTAAAGDAIGGAVQVKTSHRTVTLSARLLSYLPSRSASVSFQTGTGPQAHVESGPPLSLVLLAAEVLPRAGTPIVAVGGDGYGAAVTLAEDYVGGRPLLLSTVEDGKPLAQPRLAPVGDLKGGRYVSGVVTLNVG